MKHLIYALVVFLLFYGIRYITVGNEGGDEASFWFGFIYCFLCGLAFKILKESTK